MTAAASWLWDDAAGSSEGEAEARWHGRVRRAGTPTLSQPVQSESPSPLADAHFSHASPRFQTRTSFFD
ncbi:hypothetical protein L1887_51734 [Cichorium endivia]|nr:hypothetical protein L1887_51734 [Cichorium endivia]